MRVLIPIVALLLGGCAVFFREGERELGVLPLLLSKDVVVRTVLPRTVRTIRFVASAETASVPPGVAVTVAFVNVSSDKTISVGRFGAPAVPPRTSVELFTGPLCDLLGELRFPVSTWSGRAPCEFKFHFEFPPNLSAPIRILGSCSSPPL